MHVFYNNPTSEWVLSDGHGKDLERIDVGVVREYQEQVSAEFLAAYALLVDDYVNRMEYAILELLQMFRDRNVFDSGKGE